MEILVRTVVTIIVCYAVFLVGLYAFQEKLLFHPEVALKYEPRHFPSNIEKFYIDTKDGAKLHALRSKSAPENSPIILAFGGNAHNLTMFTSYMSGLLPKAETIAVNYRGFGESTGKPNATHILKDASFALDWVDKTYPQRDIYVMGVSMGTGPATKLSQDSRVKGVMLVMPYDDLTDLAYEKFKWVPVSYLFRNAVPSIEWAPNAQAPVAIVVAGADKLIVNARSERLRDAFPNVVDYSTLSGVGHVALLEDTRLDNWIQQAFKKLQDANKHAANSKTNTPTNSHSGRRQL